MTTYLTESENKSINPSMFSHITTPKINNIRSFIESFEEKENSIRNDFLKLNSNKIDLNQAENNYANGQTYDLSTLERNLQSGNYLEKFNKEIEEILVNLNQEKFDLKKNKDFENKIKSIHKIRDKFLGDVISDLGDPEAGVDCDDLLGKLKIFNAQQQDIFSTISNDFKKSINMFDELKMINIRFNKSENQNINDNLNTVKASLDKFNKMNNITDFDRTTFNFENKKREIKNISFADYQNNGSNYTLQLNSYNSKDLQKNMFSNNEASDSKNNFMNFMKYTPIKVKKDNITFESSTNKSLNEESKVNQNVKKTERKKSETMNKEINQDNSKYKYSGETLRGVELNKTFFYILKNQISSNKKNIDKLYSQNDFCKKYCGEKLFKNLDLNQRFHLKKTGETVIHNQGCPLYKKKTNAIRTKSVPMSYREKRKNSVERDLTLLNLSLAVVRGNTNNTPSKTPKAISQNKDNSNKIPNTKVNSPSKSLRIQRESMQNKKESNKLQDNFNQDFVKFVQYNKIKNRTIEDNNNLTASKKNRNVMRLDNENKTDKKNGVRIINNKIDYSGIKSKLNFSNKK